MRLQSAGFRGDIGYQSFLYSNVTEVRRVFMFLIERLPKEVDKEHHEDVHVDQKSFLEHNLRQNIKIQLNSAWTVQYCKKFGARKFGNLVVVQGSNNGFLPQPLNVPHATAKCQSIGKSFGWRSFGAHFINENSFLLNRTERILVKAIANDIPTDK